MKRVRVFERQVITYSWVVEIGDDDEADENLAGDGVPPDATTERFVSENWVEVLP